MPDHPLVVVARLASLGEPSKVAATVQQVWDGKVRAVISAKAREHAALVAAAAAADALAGADRELLRKADRADLTADLLRTMGATQERLVAADQAAARLRAAANERHGPLAATKDGALHELAAATASRTAAQDAMKAGVSFDELHEAMKGGGHGL